MKFLKKLFCKHEWKIIKDEIIKSKLEYLRDLGYSINPQSWYATKKYVNSKYLKRTKIIVLKCKNCGKLKKIVEKI